MVLVAILTGLAVGILVGLLGIGGGIILVPTLTLLFGFSQQVAQGTSLFMLLPPLGAGALLLYWRKGLVDRWAGAACALGIFAGGYFGSRLAIGMSSRQLQGLFGVLLIAAAASLWREPSKKAMAPTGPDGPARLALVFAVASGVGVLSGFFGVGGGILLVPLLVMALGFEPHVAQGTSLVALVPPTGLLAFLNYERAGEVQWKMGLLIMPGIFLGGLAGGRLALRFAPREMRRTFAVLLLPICVWQLFTALWRQ
jgi:uncharacterized membrane protein YfcA